MPPERLAIGALAPNCTLPLWVAGLRRAVLPVVDRCIFIVGTPDNAMLRMARDELGRDGLHCDFRRTFVPHGEALTELLHYEELRGRQILLLEDDLFLFCEPHAIDRYFRLLPDVGGVIGSRMAMFGEPAPADGAILNSLIGGWGDTWGQGIYPCMMFAEVEALRRAAPELCMLARDGGDVGHWVGVDCHRAGIHACEPAHLPQRRLTPYPGCRPLPTGQPASPWVHVGQMSVAAGWRRPDDAGGEGWAETVGAYAAALDVLGTSAVGAQQMGQAIGWGRAREQFDAGRFDVVRAMLGAAWAHLSG
jgi:hypothetical protein